MVRYENGCSMELEFSWASNIECEYRYCELYGTKGGLRFANGELTLFTQVNGVSVDSKPKLAKDTAWGNAETRYYVDCIRKNKEPLARPEEAVIIMQIITSLYKSAEKHKEVTIN
jgi:predicted dehydrogenase